MRVLVTGGAGYIGSHTAKLLAAHGHQTVVLDNLTTGNIWAVRWGPLVQADIADGEAVRNILEQHAIEAVIHFAAKAYVGESMEMPHLYFHDNVAGSLSLIASMLEAGVKKIVFSSSCATYGNPQELPIREGHPQYPINPYGESKLFIEKVLDWYGRAYDLQWVVLRYFNAAGADPDGAIGEHHVPETHLIPLAIRAAIEQRSRINIFGTTYSTPDGTAVRDYVHVGDLARAHLLALDYLRDGGTSVAVNLGSGIGYSVRQVLGEVERVTGTKVPTCEMPCRPGDPSTLIADPSKAREVLKWQAVSSQLSCIVQSAWNWHYSHLPKIMRQSMSA